MFRKILIANRGEIACRVARTARRMGVSTVAVYSEADITAWHVSEADEAVLVGPAPARDSYLAIDKIMSAARATGAEAIHPGYGFLSENADFAAACEAAGIAFIGPPASAMRAMGSKSAAKSLMAKAGVPLLPGYHGEEQTVAHFTAEAARIGYPVALKAVAGGGGKGIRIVRRAEDLAEAFDLARREALASFGSDVLLLEKFLERPRHVEVQIFADTQGNAVHLFDRDCSAQRRHQKVIEEAPAPGLPQEMRDAMAEAALMAARSVGYVGAGTVEFLCEDGRFYFMEMNTRLQVEHPVTEAITGLDLVEWQLRVAAGEPLPMAQSAIHRDGHAIEARLCAEDPPRDFMPATGLIQHLAWTVAANSDGGNRRGADGLGTRIDTGFRAGDRIGIYYDSLLAKLIAYGQTRDEAIARLRQALAGMACVGLATNQAFLHALLGLPTFADPARLSTGLIAGGGATLMRPPTLDADLWAAAALALWHGDRQWQAADPWAAASGWRLNGPAEYAVTLRHDETRESVGIARIGACITAQVRGAELRWDKVAFDQDRVQLVRGGEARMLRFWRQGETIALFDGPHGTVFHRDDGLTIAAQGSGAAAGDVRAPMPGTVTALYVTQGQTVKKGERLVSLEAMKMVHNLTAPKDGVIAELRARVGQQVEEQQALVVMGGE